jgi:hypothetical protein
MAVGTDHVLRDAEHAARTEISVYLAKFNRRMYAEAKAHIGEALTEAGPGAVVDGTAIGKAAAARAFDSYITSEAIDHFDGRALEAAGDSAT